MAVKASKLPSGSWRCRVSYTDEYGKVHRRSFTDETKRKAEIKAAQFLVEVKHQANPANKTLGQIADEYINSRTNVLSPATIAGYRKIRRTALQNLIDVRIGFLTPQMYQAEINAYAEGRSPKTVRNANAFFKSVLANYKLDAITEKVLLPQKEKKEVAIPSAAEIKKLLYNSDGDLHLMISFAVYLGLRRSEIAGLQWKHIDLEKRTVHIAQAKVKNEDGIYVLKVPKTYNGDRVLNLPKRIVSALPKPGRPNDFLIRMDLETFNNRFISLKERLKIDCTFHSLRHYYASVLLASGMPNKYAKERMGHATEDMLTKVYQHIFREQQAKYDDIVAKKFDELENTSGHKMDTTSF